LEEAAGSFRLDVTDRWGPGATPWQIAAGDACVIEADGEPIITGYVDTARPVLTKDSHGIAVAGRSKTCDLVDCSVIKTGGQWVSSTIGAIARELAGPFGVAVRVDVDGAVIPHVQVQQGETVFALLERLARLDGLLLTDDETGALVIRRTGVARAGGALVEGENIEEISATFTIANRFSVVHVKAQNTGFDDAFGADVSEVRASASDPAVPRYRPRLLVAEAAGGEAMARQRARWEVRRRAGRGTVADVRVAGWRQAGGRLWRAGEQVSVRAPYLHLDRTMVVGRVVYRLDDRGSSTTLSLSLPGAFDPEPQASGAGGGASGAVQWADVLAIDEVGP
jgi:prophage tail gpP-like protein